LNLFGNYVSVSQHSQARLSIPDISPWLPYGELEGRRKKKMKFLVTIFRDEDGMF